MLKQTINVEKFARAYSKIAQYHSGNRKNQKLKKN